MNTSNLFMNFNNLNPQVDEESTFAGGLVNMVTMLNNIFH